MSKQDHDSLQFRTNRLKTFTEGVRIGNSKTAKQWTVSLVDTNQLADLGFYYTPTRKFPNQITCFWCGKKEKNLDAVLSVSEFHLSNSPSCPYSLISLNLGKFIEDSDKKTFWERLGESGNSSEAVLHPHSIASTQLRQSTFKQLWKFDKKRRCKVTSRGLAKAGFYYSPLDPGSDRVICMYCDCPLEEWDAGDDPMEEHKNNSFTYCYFLDTISKELPKIKKTANLQVEAAGEADVSEDNSHGSPMNLTIRAHPSSTPSPKVAHAHETPDFDAFDFSVEDLESNDLGTIFNGKKFDDAKSTKRYHRRTEADKNTGVRKRVHPDSGISLVLEVKQGPDAHVDEEVEDTEMGPHEQNDTFHSHGTSKLNKELLTEVSKEFFDSFSLSPTQNEEISEFTPSFTTPPKTTDGKKRKAKAADRPAKKPKSQFSDDDLGLDQAQLEQILNSPRKGRKMKKLAANGVPSSPGIFDVSNQNIGDYDEDNISFIEKNIQVQEPIRKVDEKTKANVENVENVNDEMTKKLKKRGKKSLQDQLDDMVTEDAKTLRKPLHSRRVLRSSSNNKELKEIQEDDSKPEREDVLPTTSTPSKVPIGEVQIEVGGEKTPKTDAEKTEISKVESPEPIQETENENEALPQKPNESQVLPQKPNDQEGDQIHDLEHDTEQDYQSASSFDIAKQDIPTQKDGVPTEQVLEPEEREREQMEEKEENEVEKAETENNTTALHSEHEDVSYENIVDSLLPLSELLPKSSLEVVKHSEEDTTGIEDVPDEMEIDSESDHDQSADKSLLKEGERIGSPAADENVVQENDFSNSSSEVPESETVSMHNLSDGNTRDTIDKKNTEAQPDRTGTPKQETSADAMDVEPVLGDKLSDQANGTTLVSDSEQKESTREQPEEVHNYHLTTEEIRADEVKDEEGEVEQVDVAKEQTIKEGLSNGAEKEQDRETDNENLEMPKGQDVGDSSYYYEEKSEVKEMSPSSYHEYVKDLKEIDDEFAEEPDAAQTSRASVIGDSESEVAPISNDYEVRTSRSPEITTGENTGAEKQVGEERTERPDSEHGALLAEQSKLSSEASLIGLENRAQEPSSMEKSPSPPSHAPRTRKYPISSPRKIMMTATDDLEEAGDLTLSSLQRLSFSNIEASTPQNNHIRPVAPKERSDPLLSSTEKEMEENAKQSFPLPHVSLESVAAEIQTLLDTIEYLAEVSATQRELHNDAEGILTQFIAAIPEEEESMTIEEWMQHNATICGRTVRDILERLIKSYEEAFDAVIGHVERMETEPE